jgi:hypothetical protein
MSLFFVHLNQSDRFVTDIEGTDLPDIEAAKAEASATIREIAAEALQSGRELTLLSVRICSENGELLGEVFTAEALSDLIPTTALRP